MKIIKAKMQHCELVKKITHCTIKEIYSHYYAPGAVEFFLVHHNKECIMKDIENGYVYLLEDAQKIVGTVSVKENELYRLFVLPGYQGRGFGGALLDFAEKEIFKQYADVCLDASLPSKSMYIGRGYFETGTHTIPAENGDFLCYDSMQKKRK